MGTIKSDKMDLLRFATAGSVDDGKSTLIGRLLLDSKSIFEDQLEAVESTSQSKGYDYTDLALLTDGLRAEREQGITIDVAYRYFATARRSFILADCPGHVQYTRNTVTGSSTADVLVLLVDVRKGVLEQTRRHLAVAALLRVPHVVVAVNKIDLVDFDPQRYQAVAAQVAELAAWLGLPGATTLPVSALQGDNIVDRSERTPWYDGPSLLGLLEGFEPGSTDRATGFRFGVQLTLRPQSAAVDPGFAEYRGYAGLVSSGQVGVGDEVVVLPEGVRTTVTGIDLAGRRLERAVAGQSVALRLADEVDLARGALIASAADAPHPTVDIDGTLCWLDERPLRLGQRVLLKHSTRTVQAVVREITSRLDLDTVAAVAADDLALNDIGRVSLRLAAPVLAEDYAENRTGGAFLLIDPQTGRTLAAGMVRGHTVFGDRFGDAWDWQI
jgi:sulfate adenylyltransferase subunit 1